MCVELERFARSVTDKLPHTVRLMTDWSFPEPARACRRDNHLPETALCEWLVENTSTEFMAINISRALGCMGLRKEVSPLGYRPYIESLAGEVYDPHFTAEDVELRIIFNSSPEEELPWLEITVTNYSE